MFTSREYHSLYTATRELRGQIALSKDFVDVYRQVFIKRRISTRGQMVIQTFKLPVLRRALPRVEGCKSKTMNTDI